MDISLPHVTGDHINRRGTELAMLLVLAAVLQLAAGVGLAYVAGFSSVRAVLGDFHWVWLVAVAGALGVSFAGYYYAYEGIFTVAGGPTLATSQMRTVVTVGFGGFLARGGGTVDQYALEGAGADQREAKTRVSGLVGLEHGILALGGTACAIAVLAQGSGQPPLDFTLPWAIIPVPGFLIAFWLAERYRDRYGAGKAGADPWATSLSPST
jgi:hypothetical protein